MYHCAVKLAAWQLNFEAADNTRVNLLADMHFRAARRELLDNRLAQLARKRMSGRDSCHNYTAIS